MKIRNALPKDVTAIKHLLEQLDYPDTAPFLADKINELILHPDEVLFVCELDDKVVGVMSVHFIPQLALSGDVAHISYFAVSSEIRSLGIGKQMESYCEQLARARGCVRMELHCHSRRTDAHRFYERQGYIESPKFFSKKL